MKFVVCYISDRSLSARIGRAFWSRGPVALTGIRNGRRTFDDFPPLQPQSEEETDYASILQANLDLVQLFSNVHDVLYSGMGNSMRLMLAGNYVKYVDDFRSAIVGWKSNWLTLTCEIWWWLDPAANKILTTSRPSEHQSSSPNVLRISQTLYQCICIPSYSFAGRGSKRTAGNEG